MKRAAIAALALLSLTACHVDATVGVRIDEHGGGEVTARFALDRELVKTLDDLGKPVARQPRVGDLTRAGWNVSRARATDDGGVVFEVKKKFSDPAAFAVVMGELSGPNGPFRDFAVRTQRRRLRTRTSLQGDVVLQGDTAGVSDTPGVDTGELQAALQDASKRYVTVRVAAVLPGKVDDNAPHHVGGQPVWVPAVGDRIHLVATATRNHWKAPALALVAAVLAAAAVAVVVIPLVRRRATKLS